MGLLSFLFGGGNIAKIAQSIAYHHNRLGSFQEVLQIYLSDFKSRPSDSRKFEKARYAVLIIEEENIIRNYRDLAALAIAVDAAPASHHFYEVKENFGKELESKLERHGLAKELVSGNALKI